MIDEDLKVWNESLVRASFIEDDADAILSTPISKHGTPEKGVWHYTVDGKFTVRSAYFVAKSLAMPRRSKEKGESSSSESSPTKWKEVWRIPIPNKVRHFIWKCMHNAIAVMDNLNRKGIDINPLCPRCHKERETVEHIFFRCKETKVVWQLSPIIFGSVGEWKNMTFHQWWSSCSLGQCDNENGREVLALAAFVCWFLWKGRNRLRFEQLVWSPTAIMDNALDAWREFIGIQTLDKAMVKPPPLRDKQTWTKPPSGVIKINVDAALDHKSNICGMGLVARNAEGLVVGAAMESFSGSYPARIVKAMGFRLALQMAIDWNFSQVMVEGDALQVIQALTRSKTYVDCDSIVLDCIKLASHFQLCSFTHVFRECNRVAHSVAKHSLLEVRKESWREDFPSWLSNLALADVRASGPLFME